MTVKERRGLSCLLRFFVGATRPRRSQRAVALRDDRHQLRIILILWSAKCR